LKIRLLALTLASLFLLGCQAQPELERFGAFPDVHLIDARGIPFTSDQLGGRAALVDFIYTRCTEACPVLSANTSAVQKRLRDAQLLGSRAVLLSVTVDPVHDTPAALSEYAARYGADAESWKFLTGEWDQVYDLITGLKLSARPPRPPADAPPPGGSELLHTTRVVLVDPQGQVRAYFRGDETRPDEMVDAVRRVLRP